MSKSLEALEELKLQNTESFYKTCWSGEELVQVLKYKNYFDIVEQDLQRLEEYDKVLNQHCGNCVNKEGKICVGMNAPISIETLIGCIEMDRDETFNECKRLEKENQNLKNTDSLLLTIKCQKHSNDLLEERIKKIEDAVEILKRGFTIRLEKLEPHYHIIICGNIRKLTQQEYELLKEVVEE